MNCDECGKKLATVHITKIENGKKTNLHLCENCAMQKNAIGFNTSFSINDLLTGLINSANSVPIKVDKLDFTEEIKCDICDLSYNKFRNTGRFGCSKCYKTFGEKLNPLFKKVHGNTAHTGKIPNKAGSRIKLIREIEKLKQDLNTAVSREEYEIAAELRDKIRELSTIEQEGRI